MDCRRRLAVDDDRSRRWVVDDDRYPRRWVIDDDRSRIAFYQAQSKVSLDRIDKNLDRIDKTLRSIRRMRMSSATIPRYSYSSSSASRNRGQFRIKSVVVKDYPSLELPLRWRNRPPFQHAKKKFMPCDEHNPTTGIQSNLIAYDSASDSSRNSIPEESTAATIETHEIDAASTFFRKSIPPLDSFVSSQLPICSSSMPAQLVSKETTPQKDEKMLTSPTRSNSNSASQLKSALQIQSSFASADQQSLSA